MAIRILLISALLTACAASATTSDLNSLIQFDDPKHCQPGAKFKFLLSSALKYKELPEPNAANEIYEVRLGNLAIPEQLRSQFGTPTLSSEGSTYTVNIPVKGEWKSLSMKSIVIKQVLESEGGFYLVFDEPIEKVFNSANAAGFQIPASGSVYREPNEALGVSIGIGPYLGSPALHCFEG